MDTKNLCLQGKTGPSMSQPTRYIDHYRKLITLGVPIIIGQIGMIILGFADTIMIGHHKIGRAHV